MKKKIGKVFLVGAGPGDPELLTIKAHRLLRRADAVVYDALLDSRLLKLCPKKCQKIFAGKRRHYHAMEQDAINSLLYKLASEGKNVVRLKGGDPFIFGRGGEEMEFCSTRGISVEVVPGVSSALGVPTALGVTLTDRRVAHRLTITTGHDLKSAGHQGFLYDADKTLVVLMGFHNLPAVIDKLLKWGWPQTMSAALLSCGTMPDQKIFSSSLENFLEHFELVKSRFRPPALLVVGRVVELSEKLRGKK